VPETAEELHARAAGALRMPPVEDWVSFPFDGELHPRALLPPVESEPPRAGKGGADCQRCSASDDAYLWTSERWRLWSGFDPPPGLPFVALLESREHFAEPGDLSDELAAELGVLTARIERAVRAVGEIGRVHVCRWGDGSEHLHWWFMARPARLPQVRGTFTAIWDDVLPPLPEDLWRANLAAFADALATEMR